MPFKQCLIVKLSSDSVCSIIKNFLTFFIYFSHHPYLFFNNDGSTFTFFGLNLNTSGDLVHKSGHHSDIVETALMKQELYGVLSENMKFDIVNFQTDYESLPR